MTDHLREERLAKLETILGRNIEPYGRAFPKSQTMAEIAAGFTDEAKGSETVAAGRITALRPHGKAAFLDLRDWSGRLQVYVKLDVVGEEQFDLFRQLDLGDFLGVKGTLDKTRTGEVTVFATDLTILSKALRPLPEKWHGLRDVETRYRQRYLDLVSNEDVMKIFITRAKVVAAIRRYLDGLGFLEVETPMMQTIPGGAAAKPFVTHHNTLDMDLYLRVAPELFLKRLLVGGMEKVYEINRNFRNEGISPRHNPEFTMLELYQAYADYNVMMQLAENIVRHAAQEALGTTVVKFGEVELDFGAPWARRTYADLLEQYAGVSVNDEAGLVEKARALGIEVEGQEVMALPDEIFKHAVEPHLVQPTFIMDYPAALCPLSKTKPGDTTIAERFEPFVCGMELGNAYSELNDPIDQAARFRAQLGRTPESTGSIDEDYVTALEHGMPPAGGLGIGIDRLVMLLTDAPNIREVILFPLLRPEGG